MQELTKEDRDWIARAEGTIAFLEMMREELGISHEEFGQTYQRVYEKWIGGTVVGRGHENENS
jgi:hypothetical protein